MPLLNNGIPPPVNIEIPEVTQNDLSSWLLKEKNLGCAACRGVESLCVRRHFLRLLRCFHFYMPLMYWWDAFRDSRTCFVCSEGICCPEPTRT